MFLKILPILGPIVFQDVLRNSYLEEQKISELNGKERTKNIFLLHGGTRT